MQYIVRKNDKIIKLCVIKPLNVVKLKLVSQCDHKICYSDETCY